jgi:hypothetical protein
MELEAIEFESSAGLSEPSCGYLVFACNLVHGVRMTFFIRRIIINALESNSERFHGARPSYKDTDDRATVRCRGSGFARSLR